MQRMRNVLLLFLLFFSQIAIAQHDSAYYNSYTHQITARYYFSQKYTNLLVVDGSQKIDLNYRPNTTLNMGIGASYKWFTLNLAYGFAFLNQEKEKGKTKYLDLQAHLFGDKANIDFFGQFYNGFYLYPKGKGKSDNSYYIRPDLIVREFGGSYQYFFNHKRYSFKAAFLQNEWQKKSSGSFLIGGEAYLGKIAADSTIFPATLNEELAPNSTKLHFYELGPNFGYTYTLIIAKHFFITGSLSFSFDYNVTQYKNANSTEYLSGITPNSLIRAFAGYNSEKNAVSITFTNSRVSLSNSASKNVALNTGNFRINFVRRFIPGKKTLRWLKPIDFLSK